MALARFRCPCSRRRPGQPPPPKATPLPLLKVVTVASVLFVNQFGSMMIFPFLPFMIHDFFPNLCGEELGKKAGYLGSAFFMGNFIGSLGWGWLSDLIGRRPVMLLGLCGTICTELLFGFSQNFAWAVSARFLWGLLNGNLGVGKTYISEICDDTNQARGFSSIGTGSGLGRLIGSVVGGFLAQPASKYALFQTPFFCQFPYLLPCLAGVAIGVFALIAAYLFLDETLHTKKKKRDSNEREKETSSDSGIELSKQVQDDEVEVAVESNIAMAMDRSDSAVVMESDIDTESEAGILSFDESATSDTELLMNVERDSERVGDRRKRFHKVKQWAASWSPTVIARTYRHRASVCWTSCGVCMAACSSCTPRQVTRFMAAKLRAFLHKLLEMAKLMMDRRVFLSTSLYSLLGGIAVMLNEVFPLLMVTAYHQGGYKMDDNELGIVIMCSGIIQLLWQLLAFPYIVKWLGYRKAFQIGLIVFFVASIIIPFTNQITGPIDGTVEDQAQNTSLSSCSAHHDLNDTFLLGENMTSNGTDFCGNDLEDTIRVNDNSIKRIPFVVWLTLMMVMILSVVSKITAFVSLMVLIGNSALPSTRGTVNGISQSLVAIGRSIGPLTGSILFAWSESNGNGWPLNYHFVFDLGAACTLMLIFMSLFLPKSMEKKREVLEGTSS